MCTANPSMKVARIIHFLYYHLLTLEKFGAIK